MSLAQEVTYKINEPVQVVLLPSPTTDGLPQEVKTYLKCKLDQGDEGHGGEHGADRALKWSQSGFCLGEV